MEYLQEFPLVFFTLLVQMAVGMVLVGKCVLGNEADRALREGVRRQNVAALLLFAVAGGISFVHLGTPLHAPFTLLHVAQSWLSREILMVGVVGLALLWLVLVGRKKQAVEAEKKAMVLAGLCGIVLLFTMSCVYNQGTMPGWQNWGVFTAFLASMSLLGASWHAVVLSMRKEGAPVRALGPCLVWAVLGLVLMAVSLPLAMPEQSYLVNPVSRLLPPACIAGSHGLHALVSGLGVVLLALGAARGMQGKGLKPALTVAAFILIVLGEVFGRLVFYLSYSRLGM
ncbi:DmsC/YnfH family molybdoenzyme membrane anchor subunit [Desulfovibrio sp.]|uniref:dimethyl sulfoxide reductase anchor subunit family protein n=1 Tax=Desulfovibrio sp. TaxID=885 RepID=UPI0025C32403|nr:DmsC/YnfH family molybdoenzyme membrane anchor subunit [Desulfovibrio sp.]